MTADPRAQRLAEDLIARLTGERQERSTLRRPSVSGIRQQDLTVQDLWHLLTAIIWKRGEVVVTKQDLEAATAVLEDGEAAIVSQRSTTDNTLRLSLDKHARRR